MGMYKGLSRNEGLNLTPSYGQFNRGKSLSQHSQPSNLIKSGVLIHRGGAGVYKVSARAT